MSLTVNLLVIVFLGGVGSLRGVVVGAVAVHRAARGAALAPDVAPGDLRRACSSLIVIRAPGRPRRAHRCAAPGAGRAR